ncbi:glutathione S-transferase [Dissophora ornata]|nr:hypothetical protein BGZ58_003539 [Dissophora ornata]KAI8601188.1 glutathione S-transferase [Dissophora ornata]
MTQSNLPVPTKASSQVLSEALKSTDSTYKILYFGLHGRGEMARMLLAFGGAKWEEITMEWPKQKQHTPFQCVPVVYETTSDGTVLQVGETAVIERYLAKKFNLVGKNEWEQLLIEEFHFSTESTQLMYHHRVLVSPQEKRVDDANAYYSEWVAKFITVHEAHLEKNGSNGHYVGNDFSLADIKTTVFMDRLALLMPKGADFPLSAEKTPNLWKVREAVNNHPNVAAWTSSQRYNELNANTTTAFRI